MPGIAVKTLLEHAGFRENITYRETRFLKPPKSTYAVFNDTKTVRGADLANNIIEHAVSIEVYEYAPDPEAEGMIEAVFDEYAVSYTKNERYWIDDQQLYQIIYEYSWIEKKRKEYEHV